MAKKKKFKDDFDDSDEVSERSFWKYEEEGDKIIGEFIGFEKDKYGQHGIIDNGEERIHLPNLVALNSKLERTNEGDKVKVEYLGEKKAEESGRTYKDFKVYTK